MARVIAFSGGCHSGKTTTLNKVAENLEAEGHKVVKLTELIRETTNLSIDELRKNPSEYLCVQEDIIPAKINQERAAFKDPSDTIYLVDRAITDSLFYLENYVDKSKLTEEEIVRLCNLDSAARMHASDAFINDGYDMLLVFEPIDTIKEKDALRPKLLKHLKEYEYQGIDTLNRAYALFGCSNFADLYDFYVYINVQCNSIDYTMEAIKGCLSI